MQSRMSSAPGVIPIQKDGLFTEQTIQVSENEPRHYVKCEFNKCRFNGSMSEHKFIQCRFNDVTFGPICDTLYFTCSFESVQFPQGMDDCKFEKCSINAMHGTWQAQRCLFRCCSFSKFNIRKDASLRQCTLVDSHFSSGRMQKAHVVDTTVKRCNFTLCHLSRGDIRRCKLHNCVIDQSNTTNSTWAGNVWRGGGWTMSNDSYSRHLAEEEYGVHYRKHVAQHTHFTQYATSGCRYENIKWSWTKWDACCHRDDVWIDVCLKNAKVKNTKYHNISHTNVTQLDTIYQNVERSETQFVTVTVHFYENRGNENSDVDVTLFSRHRRMSSTNKTSFELKDTLARQVDFVYVIPVLGWLSSLGFSSPNSAHHIVSHITIGENTYWPQKTAYSVHGASEKIGYYRQRIARHNSEPELSRLKL